MSQNKLTMQGLGELREALRRLPAELAQEGATIVLSHAEEAKGRIVQAYPDGPTGNLKRGVTVDHNTDRQFSSVSAIVRSRARHASMFEKGTVTRRTRRGWNRGRMPHAPTHQQMIPIVVSVRRRMVRALIDLVRRAGFTVTE